MSIYYWENTKFVGYHNDKAWSEFYDKHCVNVSEEEEEDVTEEITQLDIDNFFGCEDTVTVNKEK